MLRKILIVLGLVVLYGGAVAMMKMKNSKKPSPRKPATSQVKQVRAKTAESKDISSSIPIYGRLQAFESVEIYSEVNGMALEGTKTLREGAYYAKGEELVRIEKIALEANLKSQKAAFVNQLTQLLPDLKLDYPESFDKWKTYIDNFNINQTIKALPEPSTEKEGYFLAAKSISNTYYNIKSQEVQLPKYVIRAPISGTVVQGSVTPGTYIRAGQLIGSLVNTYTYELVATISLADMKYLKVGDKVTLRSEAMDQNWTGKVKRFSSSIDPNTQSAKAFIGVSGKGLKEGMYLNGEVLVSEIKDVVSIQRGLLLEGEEINVIEGTLLKRIPVEVVKIEGEMALVRGIPDGTVVADMQVSGANVGDTVKVLLE